MPLAKLARQIWTEKLGLVHPLPFSGVIFREIGHLATIHEIYKIKLYCIVIILYRMHKKPPKKHTPRKAAAIRLTLLLFPMCTKPHARYQNSEPPNQRNRSRFASRSNCTHLKEMGAVKYAPQYHIYIDNIFRACGKNSLDKKPRARLLYITIRVNQI